MYKNFSKTFLFAKEYIIFGFLILWAVMLAVNVKLSGVVMDGISLWAVCVLPSVFPYFFISSILSSMQLTSKLSSKLSPVMNKIFNLGGITGYAYLMSLIAGYPMGAKLVSDLRNQKLISKEESVRASALCSTSSPMFLIASVGGIMFNSTLFGALLLACNFLSSVTVGVIFSFYKRNIKPSQQGEFIVKRQENLIADSVYGAVNSSLFVGGMITLFFVLIEMLVSLKILSPFIFLFEKIFNSRDIGQAITFGLFEYTRGLKVLGGLGITFFSLPLASFILGFGGLSIIMQSAVFLKGAKIKIAPFILSKILGATLSFIYAIIFSLIFFV